MEENIDNNVSVLAMLDNQCTNVVTVYKSNMDISNYSQNHQLSQDEQDTAENSKQSIIWTKNATVMLLSLYETKIHMLDNPKKKSKMWNSIAEELKALSVDVTPDQVRWKVNALTKKYKDCIDNRQGASVFKYFNEMHQILGRYNNDNDAYRLASGVLGEDAEKEREKKNLNAKTIPFRKFKAERRSKLELDKQWLEYLKRQEAQKLERDERYERSLILREEELKLKKRELEIKQTIALKKLQLKEKKQEEILKIEREKCALLRKLVADRL